MHVPRHLSRPTTQHYSLNLTHLLRHPNARPCIMLAPKQNARPYQHSGKRYHTFVSCSLVPIRHGSVADPFPFSPTEPSSHEDLKLCQFPAVARKSILPGLPTGEQQINKKIPIKKRVGRTPIQRRRNMMRYRCI